MREVICDTSPIQYLYQLGILHILPALAERVVVPPAVVEELSVGEAAGVNLPDITEFEWAIVRSPISEPALPLRVRLAGGGSTKTP